MDGLFMRSHLKSTPYIWNKARPLRRQWQNPTISDNFTSSHKEEHTSEDLWMPVLQRVHTRQSGGGGSRFVPAFNKTRLFCFWASLIRFWASRKDANTKIDVLLLEASYCCWLVWRHENKNKRSELQTQLVAITKLFSLYFHVWTWRMDVAATCILQYLFPVC